MPGVAITVEGMIADVPAHLVEALRQAVMDAFERSEPVGEEIAGILFGRKTSAGWTVVAWRPIPREDTSRPAVPLTDGEEEAAGELLWDYRSDPELRRTEPIGWVRSRTRGMAALSPEDAQVCARFFGKEGCLALILRPSTQRPMTGAFFQVSTQKPSDASRRGVEVSIEPDPEAIPAERDRLETLLAEFAANQRPLFMDFHEPPRRSRWKTVAGGAAIAAMLLLCAYIFLDRPIRLDGRVDASRLLLTWNGQAGVLTGANGAEIDISGNSQELTLSELRAGRIGMPAPSGDFKVVLRLRGPNANEQRAVLTMIRASPGGTK